MPLLLVNIMPTPHDGKIHDTMVDVTNPKGICSRAIIVSRRLTIFVVSSLTAHDFLI